MSLREQLEVADVVTRDVATDVFVLILYDLDREKGNGQVLVGIPVMYGFSGKSLPMKSVRKLCEWCVKVLREKGLKIVTRRFHGQMATLAFYDHKGEPLTLMHAQKRCYEQSKKLSPDLLVRDILKMAEDQQLVNSSNNDIALYGSFIEIREDYNDKAKEELLQINKAVQRSPQEARTMLHPLCEHEVSLQSDWSSLLSDINADQNEQMDEHIEEEEIVQRTPDDETEFENFIAEVENELVRDTQVNQEDITEHTGGLQIFNEDAMPSVAEPNGHSDCVRKKLPASTDAHFTTARLEMIAESDEMEQKWSVHTSNQILCMLKNAELIEKHMKDTDLRVLIRSLKSQKAIEIPPGMKRKGDRVNFLSSVYGDGSKSPRETSILLPKDMTAKDIVQQNIKKKQLSILHATLSWPSKLRKWWDLSVLHNGTSVLWIDATGKSQCLAESIHWFTKPEIDPEGLPMFIFLDPHHLHVNSRQHIVNAGYKAAGIETDAWKRVAADQKSNGTKLHKALVDRPTLDPQSGATAEIFFRSEVAKCMHENGDYQSARYCQLLYEWHKAFDDRGVGEHRIPALLELRKWCLEQIVPSLTLFPTCTTHVNDIPTTTFAGFIISCERAIQIHNFVKGGALNYRSLGSPLNETYFSTFRDLDTRGLGILHPDEFPRAIGTSCMLMQTRMNKNR